MASLDSVRLKIAWASKHLESLHVEAVRYLNDKANDVVGDFQPDGDVGHRLAIHFAQVKPVPEEISLRFGDCLHNLRSALDYLVWELILAAKNEPTYKNMFPICTTSEAFANARRRHRLDGVSAEAIAEIESLQPFNNAEPTSDRLFALDELINIDKHRRLLIVATRNIGGEVVFTDHAGTKTQSGLAPGYDGTTIAIGPPLVHQQKVRMQGKCIVYVALQEGAAKDMDISTVLTDLRDYTSFIVDRFARFF